MLQDKARKFTLIELIVVVTVTLIVTVPLYSMMVPMLQEWFKSKEIRALQQDVDLAAYSVKGLIEEAYDYEENGWPASLIELKGTPGSDQVVIKQEGRNLMINDYAVIDILTENGDGLIFDPDEEMVKVTITARAEGRTYKKEFAVRLRNYNIVSPQ